MVVQILAEQGAKVVARTVVGAIIGIAAPCTGHVK